MIKILHVVGDLNRNGGMMSVIMNYYRNIDRNLIQFDFLSFESKKNDYSDEIVKLGGKVYELGRPKISVDYIKSINNFFENHNGEYKVLHCHPIFASEIFAIPAKKNGINYVIAHSHSTKYSNKKISGIRNKFINMFVKKCATNFMACSREASKLFGKINDKDIYILNNAIECNKFKFNYNNRTKIRKRFNLEDSDFVLAHIGRFSSEKNHFFLVDVFKEVYSINKKSRLILVGDGPLKSEVIEYVNGLNLSDKVIFTGERKDISEILSSIDIFLLPSIFEGVPMVALEAQASGALCFFSSNITKIVSINNVTYLDIEEGAKKWAININNINYNQNNRENSYLKVKDAGFDIIKEAKELERYYINL